MFLKIWISLKDDGIFCSFEKIITIDISSKWHQFPIDFESISHSYIFWMTGKWNDISFFKSRELFKYFRAYFRKSSSVTGKIISFSTSFILYWLKSYSSDTFLLYGEFEDFSYFLIVLSFFYHDDESSRNIVFIEVFYSFYSYFCEIDTAYFFQIVLIERVKLKIDFKIWLITCQFFYKFLIFCYFYTICIDHQVAKRSFLCSIQYLEKVWMNRRFSSGNLHDIWFSFVCTDCIEEFFYFFQ